MNEATESVREQIEYDLIIGEDGYDAELVDEVVAQMVEAICSTKPNIRVAGENRSADVVRSRLLELNRFHVEFVLDCMRENTTEIRNIRAYCSRRCTTHRFQWAATTPPKSARPEGR